jgi:hypothetical protein
MNRDHCITYIVVPLFAEIPGTLVELLNFTRAGPAQKKRYLVDILRTRVRLVDSRSGFVVLTLIQDT